jgi:hypothetical protein
LVLVGSGDGEVSVWVIGRNRWLYCIRCMSHCAWGRWARSRLSPNLAQRAETIGSRPTR